MGGGQPRCKDGCAAKTFNNAQDYVNGQCRLCAVGDSPEEDYPTLKCQTCEKTIESYSPCQKCHGMICRECRTNPDVWATIKTCTEHK